MVIDVVHARAYTLHLVCGRSRSYILELIAISLVWSISSIASLRCFELTAGSTASGDSSAKIAVATLTKPSIASFTFILRCPSMIEMRLPMSGESLGLKDKETHPPNPTPPIRSK
jgi:hypothetical protein